MDLIIVDPQQDLSVSECLAGPAKFDGGKCTKTMSDHTGWSQHLFKQIRVDGPTEWIESECPTLAQGNQLSGVVGSNYGRRCNREGFGLKASTI
jgi:hypothetical protein